MNKCEAIARQLAAELSETGEQDWRGFVILAQEVHERLEQQFQRILGPLAADVVSPDPSNGKTH